MALVPGAFKPGIEVIDFTTYEREAILFDTVACEFSDIAGFKADYYIHKSSSTDMLYGEDMLESYDGPYTTKIMYQPEKEHHLTDAFGMSSADTIVNAEMPKTIFTRDVLTHALDAVIPFPKVKDIIKTLWNNKVYEISDITDENKVFLGNKLIWTLTLTPVRYSEQSSVEPIIMSQPTTGDMPTINFSFDTPPTSAIGDNDIIETESNAIDDYADVDTKTYGY